MAYNVIKLKSGGIAMIRGRNRSKRLYRFEIPVLILGYATLLYWLARGVVYVLVLLKGN